MTPAHAVAALAAAAGALAAHGCARVRALPSRRRLRRLQESACTGGGVPRPAAASPAAAPRAGPPRRARRASGAECEDVLLHVAESLRAGESLPQALRRAQRETGGGWSALLAEALARYDGGAPLTRALAPLEATGERAARLLVRAVEIHRRTGGNLAEALLKLAAGMREERLLQGEIAARTAEARWTAYCVAATPVLLLLYFLAGNPSLLAPLLTHPAGNAGLAYALVSWSTGFAVLRRLTRF